MSDIIDIAQVELGKHISDGGTNTVPYWAELQPNFQGQPWCAGFVSWCAKHSGLTLPAIDHPWGYSYCPDAVSYAQGNGLWQSNGLYQRNDVIFFDWDGDGEADHTGLVLSDDGKTVVTIEGNTGPEGWTGNQSNGDGVYMRHRAHGPMIMGVLDWSKVTANSLPKPKDNTPLKKPTPTHSTIDDTFKTKTRDTFHTLSYLVNGNANLADKIWIFNPGLKDMNGERPARGKFDTYLRPNQTVHIKWAHRPIPNR